MLENGSVLAGWHTGASCISNPADLSRVASQYHAPTNTHTHTHEDTLCALCDRWATGSYRTSRPACPLAVCLPWAWTDETQHGAGLGETSRHVGSMRAGKSASQCTTQTWRWDTAIKGHASQPRRQAASQNARGKPRHARVGRAFLHARQPNTTYIIIMPRSSANCCSASLKLTCTARAAVNMPHTNKTRRMRQSETAGSCSL